MKGRCMEADYNGIYYFMFEGQQPKEGVEYLLEDATNKTSQQNKAFHPLLGAFWQWMNKTDNFVFQDGNRFFDLSTPSPEDFKQYFKSKYGAGFDSLEYVNDKNGMTRINRVYYVKDKKTDKDKRFTRTIDEALSLVPDYAMTDFNNGNRGRIKSVLKSWGDYTVKEARTAIDNLKIIISISGCNDKKVEEIIKGMEK